MTKDFSAILKKANLKVTSARQAILETFSSDCKPINAEYIQEKLKGKGFNLVTIYRTLTSLETNGALKRVDLRKESTYYELADQHHHHVICTDCGRVEKFDACFAETLSKQALKSSEYFNSIGQHSLELFGVCNACAK